MDTTLPSVSPRQDLPLYPWIWIVIEPFVKGDTMRISCDIVQLMYSERALGSGGFGTNYLIIVSSTIL